MIFWTDFVLDDVAGPLLVVPEADSLNREERSDDPGVMDDARSEIQETRQELWPARMVGLSSLDSTVAQAGRDAGWDRRFTLSRRREEG